MNAYLFAVISLFGLYITSDLVGEESVPAPEEPKEISAAVISEPEVIVKSNEEHNLEIYVNNNYQAKSRLTVEVRKGGCDGEMIARFPLAVNDSVSYNCRADYVRIVPDDPGVAKYSYRVKFTGTIKEAVSRMFDASGRNSIFCYFSNRNSTSTEPIIINSKTNEGVENATIDFEPKVYGYIDDAADAISVEAAEGAKGSSYYVRFSSR